jgi:nitroreductase/dihydropteridine reductase
MSTFLSRLEWRHATKAFAPAKPVSDAQLEKILQAIRMAPTSYGLQPFHIEVIKDQSLKEKLAPHAYNQRQITTCTALLVFVAATNIEKRIDQYFTAMTGGNADARGAMKDYEGMMRGTFKGKTEDEMKNWTAKQAYIALGFGLAACAELEIDSCPMEGFNPVEFDQALGLSKGHYSSVVLTVGYRDPAVPAMPKFRFPDADLFRRK